MSWKRSKVSLSLSAMLDSQLDRLRNFIAMYTLPWKPSASSLCNFCDSSCFPAYPALSEPLRPTGDHMEPGRWQTFLKWLHDTGLLTERNGVSGSCAFLVPSLAKFCL